MIKTLSDCKKFILVIGFLTPIYSSGVYGSDFFNEGEQINPMTKTPVSNLNPQTAIKKYAKEFLLELRDKASESELSLNTSEEKILNDLDLLRPSWKNPKKLKINLKKKHS